MNQEYHQHRATRFVVYCDESRHDSGGANSHMGIGGLWVPRARRDELRQRLDEVATRQGLRGELKWSKVSAKSLGGYKAIVRQIVEEPDLRFRIIIVDHRKTDYASFQGGDSELGFYKFYYQMLVKWLEPDRDYVILLDHRVNSRRGRHSTLRDVLQNSVSERTVVRRVDFAESRISRLAQLADILTGTVTAAWCDTRRETPKAALQDYLAKSLGWSGLAISSMSPTPGKFNVFAIQLSGKPGDNLGAF